MSHTCHALGCNRRVPRTMFMCRAHWFSLAPGLRRRIWATYRPGQCDDYQISRAYADAAQESIRFVAREEGRAVSGREPELTLYDRLVPQEHGAPETKVPPGVATTGRRVTPERGTHNA